MLQSNNVLSNYQNLWALNKHVSNFVARNHLLNVSAIVGTRSIELQIKQNDRKCSHMQKFFLLVYSQHRHWGKCASTVRPHRADGAHREKDLWRLLRFLYDGKRFEWVLPLFPHKPTYGTVDELCHPIHRMWYVLFAVNFPPGSYDTMPLKSKCTLCSLGPLPALTLRCNRARANAVVNRFHEWKFLLVFFSCLRTVFIEY